MVTPDRKTLTYLKLPQTRDNHMISPCLISIYHQVGVSLMKRMYAHEFYESNLFIQLFNFVILMIALVFRYITDIYKFSNLIYVHRISWNYFNKIRIE